MLAYYISKTIASVPSLLFESKQH